jgi:hypothetical protein
MRGVVDGGKTEGKETFRMLSFDITPLLSGFWMDEFIET